MDHHVLSPWRRLKVRVRQANTWLIIALLALAGWTVDALRLFLDMHKTLWSGLGAFASHFWYAVPMVVAIVVLTRLHPKAKLLGLAAYDETGHLVYHRGDFHLDDLTVKGMLASLRESGEQGLHSIALPSGARAYFVREGGLTLMLSFSGPASPQDLTAEVQKLQAELPPALNLLDGLEPPVAALAASLLTSPVKRNVLAFFRQHGQMAIQARDLAYWVGTDEEQLVRALEELIDLGLVQRQYICGATFYSLSQSPEAAAYLDRLFTWRSEWQMTLERLEQTIGRDHIAEVQVGRYV